MIATDNWFNTENVAGTGPYVGWKGFDPTIDFFFAALHSFTDVTFYFDDSNGAGGVDQPSQVTINSTIYNVPTHAGSAPFAFTVDLAGLTTDQLTVNIKRSDEWVFLSEVTFAAVPLPAGGLLLLGGLGGLAALCRRGKKAA